MLSGRLDGETMLVHEPRWEGQEQFLRESSRAGRLTAPCCGARLILRWGLRKARHFAHAPRARCPYDRWSEPESAEHLAGKIMLYGWCRDRLAGQLRTLALEHPLPESLQRPDLYLELTDGTRYAIEYQRSAIGPGEWQERHDSYARQGIFDIWILGENRLTAALPTPEQQERWAARERHMLFLNLRAFENLAALQSPYEQAWWRGDQQEALWDPLELDARVGREVSPWFERSALSRLRSVSFLDPAAGQLIIYRAMRELPGHLDTRMASVCLRTPMSDPGLGLTSLGFVTTADRERQERFQRRKAALLAQIARHRAGRTAGLGPDSAAWPASGVAEPSGAYRALPAGPLPSYWPPQFRSVAERRSRQLGQVPFDPTPFLLHEQERRQQEMLQKRAGTEEWRRLVERQRLTPDTLFFLVGIPIPDDTVFRVHRTVWQAHVSYMVLRGLRRGLTARWLSRLLARRFGIDSEMERLMRVNAVHGLNTVEGVVGAFLNLLAHCGYLRNDYGSEFFRYFPAAATPPALAFINREERWSALAGLLDGSLRLEGESLVGLGRCIGLRPVWSSALPERNG